MEGQLSLFDIYGEHYKVSKFPVRLIEMFAGVGSQAMALKKLGVPMEHHRVIEYDKYAVASYNAIHGTNVEPSDIRDVKGVDLGIVDKGDFTYLLTYSFPCQDLSVAGKQKGMTKGSGTRSGLLWEVERILYECKELDAMPDILLMENVPMVHGADNKQDFFDWISSLEQLGYTNYWDDLNAKHYGVAQSRDRTFMISLYNTSKHYTFPKTIPLTKCMDDYLEQEVEERYYIGSDKARELIDKLVIDGKVNV